MIHVISASILYRDKIFVHQVYHSDSRAFIPLDLMPQPVQLLTLLSSQLARMDAKPMWLI